MHFLPIISYHFMILHLVSNQNPQQANEAWSIGKESTEFPLCPGPAVFMTLSEPTLLLDPLPQLESYSLGDPACWHNRL